MTLTVLLAVLSACSPDDTYLPALLADPMASYEAEGLVLFDSWEYRQRSSFLGSGPRQAEVVRRYRVEDQSQAEEILNEAREVAESEGWQIQQESEFAYSGVRELDPGMGRLFLMLQAEDILDDPDGPRVLAIFLEFDPVPSDETTISN